MAKFLAWDERRLLQLRNLDPRMGSVQRRYSGHMEPKECGCGQVSFRIVKRAYLAPGM